MSLKVRGHCLSVDNYHDLGALVTLGRLVYGNILIVYNINTLAYTSHLAYGQLLYDLKHTSLNRWSKFQMFAPSDSYRYARVAHAIY